MKAFFDMGIVLVSGTALAACGANQAVTQAETRPVRPAAVDGCQLEVAKAIFAGDPDTRVRLVRSFAKGDPMTLDGAPDAQKAPADLCVVKLMVGPGNPGPVGAPSTSEGIGIEIWLPARANWNGRIQNLGSGGLDGISAVSSLKELGGLSPLYSGGPAMLAGLGGAVSAIHDSGHVSEGPMGVMSASFLMKTDGSINEALAKDYAGRAGHETAVKTKKLVENFFGKPASHAYFAGCSNGGRQALKAAQDYPDDYDGILAGAPAINLTTMGMATFYPTVVTLQDLGGTPIAHEQLELVASAAVSACDADVTGRHSGYIGNLAACRYNPAKDPDVLCTSDGGKNKTLSCVSRRQATAINKMWYGPTTDGSVPDPALSNGYSTALGEKQLWFGVGRGTRLSDITPAGRMWSLVFSENGKILPAPLAPNFAAVLAGVPGLATPDFRNATGNGTDGWKRLTYASLADLIARGNALQGKLGYMNAINPDLSAFKASGGKLLSYHGSADQVIPMQGSDRYYESVASKMGGLASVREFYRYYQIPAFGHCFGIGQVDGIAGVSPKADPPLPGPTQMFDTLVAWVEQGKAPEDIVLTSPSGKASRPVCTYPRQVRYKGGDPDSAGSYACVSGSL